MLDYWVCTKAPWLKGEIKVKPLSDGETVDSLNTSPKMMVTKIEVTSSVKTGFLRN